MVSYRPTSGSGASRHTRTVSATCSGVMRMLCVQCGIQRRCVAAGTGLEPVAMTDCSVERGIGIPVLAEESVQPPEGFATVGLRLRSEQEMLVGTVGELEVVAVLQGDCRPPGVGGGEHAVGIGRGRTQRSGKAEQGFAGFVENDVMIWLPDHRAGGFEEFKDSGTHCYHFIKDSARDTDYLRDNLYYTMGDVDWW